MKKLILCTALWVHLVPCAHAEDPLKFLKDRVGKRVGGGECTNMVGEALRIAGMEFVGKDPQKNKDYVWGTLVKEISNAKGWKDSAPTAKVQPGDVIQYRDAAFPKSTAGHHTSFVAAVNDQGYPTHIYEQNIGAEGKPPQRTVRYRAIDLTSLTGGKVWIYRPQTQKDKAQRYNFSIVNNTDARQTVEVYLDARLAHTVTLDVANSTNSYQYAWVGEGASPACV